MPWAAAPPAARAVRARAYTCMYIYMCVLKKPIGVGEFQPLNGTLERGSEVDELHVRIPEPVDDGHGVRHGMMEIAWSTVFASA